MNFENFYEYSKKKRCVYAIVFSDNAVYVGQTQGDVATRIAQHLAQKDDTVRKYIDKHKVDFIVKTAYEYKRNHTNLQKWLYEKESQYMKDFAKCGYKLINISKMKKLGIDN